MLTDPDRLAAQFAWSRLAPEAEEFPGDRIRRALIDVLPAGRLEAYLEAADGEVAAPGALDPSRVVRALSEEERRAAGVYTTPPRVARGLAAAVREEAGVVVDPAAGTGELLLAVARRAPGAQLVGIEREWSLAVVAATRLAELGGELDRPRDRVRIHVGDGLAADAPWSRREGRVDAVLLNPPYVGEKGNRELFAGIRERHAHLEAFVGPRCDLAYLFVHRALSLLRGGGRLALLTPAYWLTATGARRLRADLSERAGPEAFVRIPSARLFAEASGHHSMVSLFRRSGAPPSEQVSIWADGGREREAPGAEKPGPVVACTLDGEPADWPALVEALVERREPPAGVEAEVARPAREEFGAEPWSPFAGAETLRWGERLREVGTPLGELLEDRQGFVSGADRVTGRRLGQLDEVPEGVEPGDPLFVWETGELTDAMEALRGLVVRPLLRGSDLEAGRVVVEPPERHVALYLDGELDDDQEWVVDHLRPLRPALENRREVRRGTMPWYRMHWPRSRREQTEPKLVVPRRADGPRFALDLSASVVSSDCTYLLAPDSVKRPVAYLKTMMRLLNHPFVDRYLRQFGKRKGGMLEFYADPLRSLPMPVELRFGQLHWHRPEVFGLEPE